MHPEHWVEPAVQQDERLSNESNYPPPKLWDTYSDVDSQATSKTKGKSTQREGESIKLLVPV